VKLDPALIAPERVLQQFYQYAEVFLALQRGYVATLKLSKVFGYQGFYAAHVAAVIKQFPPAVIEDKKGRRWVLVEIRKRRQGRGRHYYHVLVFERERN